MDSYTTMDDTPAHPYISYEGTLLWMAVEAALAELERNGDLHLSTARPHVIGFICQHLTSKQLVTKSAVSEE